jgi:hypothetical protein
LSADVLMGDVVVDVLLLQIKKLNMDGNFAW